MEVLYSILPVAGRFILVTGLLMALYWLMWRKQATYRAKRIYLLTMPLVALVISLLQVEVYKPEPVVVTVEQTAQTASSVSVDVPMDGVPTVEPIKESAVTALSEEMLKESPFTTVDILALVYALIIIGLCIPFVTGFVQLCLLRKGAKVQKDEDNDVRILVGESIKTPFSFHRSIYLPQNLTENQRRMILTHERAHILHRHYVDVWISSLVTRLLWWNPFLWWACAELRNVHEFEADSVVLGTGEDVYAYQAILIEEVLHGDIVIANGFNHSFIRRRFIEMVQSSNRRMSAWAKAGSAAWMLIVVALFCCTVGEAETVYRTVTVDASQAVMTEVPVTDIEAEEQIEVKEEVFLPEPDVMLNDTLVISKDSVLALQEIFEDSLGEGLSEELTLELVKLLVDAQTKLLQNVLSDSFKLHITREIKEELFNELASPVQPVQPISPIQNNIKEAKENEFIIEGFVNPNITDSCYLIYLADEYFNIQDEPVDTVPVVNKRFTYVLNTDKMTAGRLRCIFPGGKICENTISLYFVPGETVSLYVNDGYYNIEKGPQYADKVTKAMEAIRKETNWKSPHLPKVKGKVWKNVSDDEHPLYDVREVYFNDEETVLRIACKEYSEGLIVSKKACLVDNNGKKYRLKRAVKGCINSNNNQEARIFGGYFAFEPVRKNIQSLTYHDRGIVIKNIKEPKKGKVIY